MAIVLEVVGGTSSLNATGRQLLHSIPSHSSWRRMAASATAADGSISSGFSSSLRSFSLRPLCRGLKVNFLTRKRQTSHSRHPARDSKGIVSEAQETATAAGAVSDSTFKKLVVESEIPVLVDFWAPWCGPCRMIAPLIDELARQYAGKLKCLKLNTDESPNVAAEYGIRSIPTVMIFVEGEKRDTVIGAVPKSTLTSTIDKYVQ